MSDKTELSIDTPEFQKLVETWRNHPYGTREFETAWATLVAYIDARRATIQPTAAEPVGEVVMYPNYSTVVHWLQVMPPSGTKLYTAPVAPADAVRDARNEALEEAAKEADAHNYGPLGEYDYSYDDAKSNADDRAEEIARAIRALKSTPTEGQP